MTDAVAKRPLTTREIQHRQAVAAEIRVGAKARYSAACLALVNDKENPKRKREAIDAKEALDLLDAELEGLTAAAEEAKRVEDAKNIERTIAALEEQRGQAISDLELAVAAFEAAHKLHLTALRAANAFHDALAIASEGERELYVERHDGDLARSSFYPEVINWSPSEFARQAESSRRQIKRWTEARIQRVRDRAAGVAP